jgi:hypothetical protein
LISVALTSFPLINWQKPDSIWNEANIIIGKFQQNLNIYRQMINWINFLQLLDFDLSVENLKNFLIIGNFAEKNNNQLNALKKIFRLKKVLNEVFEVEENIIAFQLNNLQNFVELLIK